MAKVIRAVPKIPKTKRGRPHSEHITRLFNGQGWQLERGTDFTSPVQSYARNLRNLAQRRGIVAVIECEGAYVYVKARKQQRAS